MSPEPIQLWAYDLSNGMASMYGPMLIGRPLEGIWHTSLVLYDMEIFYGQGISVVKPGSTHHGNPKKRVNVGTTQLDKQTVLEYISGLQQTYTAEAYHLLEFNCNVFTNDVLGFLNGQSIPADIINQAMELVSTPFGQSMRPMIEQMFVGANRQTAGDAINLLPSLGLPPPVSASAIGTTTPAAAPRDEPAAQSISSNLQICTSSASLRSTLASSSAVAVMYTSPTCPPCTAIKPFFEDLARKHGGGKQRIEFVLVEMGVGEGAAIAHNSEFGGPVQATPTFVFFGKGKKVGECKGADKRELETQVQLLEMEAYPPHPHSKLDLPALQKLSRNLAPITFTTFPPLESLTAKLSSALSTSSCDAVTVEVLTTRVPSYLSSLPAPPTPAPTSPLPSDLLDSWLSATLTALQSLPPSAGSSKFPILDLIRLSLARDSLRLSSHPSFLTFLPRLIAHLASDLDHNSPNRSYLLTALRTISNALVSPTLTARGLAPDTLPNVTRLIVRALLDPDDERLRAAGAGLGWSVVARVFAARVGQDEAGVGVESRGEREHALGLKSEAEEGGGEEWEAEVASALVEALGKETESVEVVHRLTATLGLLVYQSPYFNEINALLEVLETKQVFERRRETVKERAGDAKEKEGVLGVLRDVEKLVMGGVGVE
ncbi:hypothetical protein JCM11641_001040 [Rhodosporidiobolus odoratus]